MRKIIFLDIDGVLNSNFWNETHQMEISDGTLIDKEKIKLLAILVNKTNAEIVLHSGWRMWFNNEVNPIHVESERLVKMLANEGMKITSLTPDLTTEEIRKTKKFSLVKADEILLWLRTHEEVNDWVVLDDLDLNNEQVKAHQVKTDAKVGLTMEDVETAFEILEMKF